MNRLKLLVVVLFSAVWVMAQTAGESNKIVWQKQASPDGNVVVAFGIDNGRPCYTMQFGEKEVIRKSYLGLELAKDKHASKGKEETDLMD